MATMNFYERATRLGQSDKKEELEKGVMVTTVKEVESLEELKLLFNDTGVNYTCFSANESAIDSSLERDPIKKVYRYIFGGEDQLMANNSEEIEDIFPVSVKVVSQKEMKVNKGIIIDGGIPVIWNNNTIIFEDGGYIDIVNNDFEINVDCVIVKGNAPKGMSRINILGRDGHNGQEGNSGANGYNGVNGANDRVAHHATSGQNGMSSGASGTNGTPGTGHNSAKIEITTSITGTLTIKTRSGKGGKGGDGGRGGNGGNGGIGGNVHVGLCKDINGGNGGNGGHGGAGSNGGDGGDSGNCNSDDVPVIVTVPSAFKLNVVAENEPVPGGEKGIRGFGGAGGKGNGGGHGNCKGRRGSHGVDGGKGADGQDGRDGKPGASSEIIVYSI